MINETTTLNQANIFNNFGTAAENLPHPLNNRVEALRVLVTVLLREVESLEQSVPGGAESLSKQNFSLAGEIERYEADMIRTALIKARGKQRRAAQILGVKVTTLNAKIKKYNINWRVIGLENELIS